MTPALVRSAPGASFVGAAPLARRRRRPPGVRRPLARPLAALPPDASAAALVVGDVVSASLAMSSSSAPPSAPFLPLADGAGAAAPREVCSLAGAGVDAWSVTGGGVALGATTIRIPPGIETQLFQAGLAPYLAYLWFLTRPEAKTPGPSKFGAVFLLAFVFATIPAGIVAKTRYGDVLANVDVLHGASESLLTVSNFLFAFGFARSAFETRRQANGAEADPAEANPFASEDLAAFDESTSATSATSATSSTSSALFDLSAPASPAAALGTFVLLTAAGAFALSDLSLGMPPHSEPSNALSLPTWAVHVSSVTEWCLAMRLVRCHAESSGNDAWRLLAVAMTPFLASAFAACAFHLFYNAPEVVALVPAQAALTLAGNAGCAIAAWNVVETGKAIEAAEREKAREAAVSAAKKMDDDARKKTRLGFGGLEDAARRFVRRRRLGAGGSNASAFTRDSLALEPDPVPPPLNPLAWAPPPSLGSSTALAAWTVAASVAVKEGELFLPGSAGAGSSFFLEPTLAKALACVALPTAAVAAVVFTTPAETPEPTKKNDEKKLSMEDVRSFGAAGTAAYVLVELAFWAVAFPAAFAWYRVAEGTWLDLGDAGDKARLLGAGAVFINGARALVPLRLAAALALAPSLQSSDAFFGGVFSSERSEGETDEDES